VRPRLAVLLLALGAFGLFVWHAKLFVVSQPGPGVRPLERTDPRTLADFGVWLPRVPVGVMRVESGRAAWLIHYWAPWERHGRAQALALDSLVREMPEFSDGRLQVAIVCFDPFPSVARFVARLRLTVPVVLDHDRELQRAVPCPSLPYTWVIAPGGGALVSQPGEVDWRSEATRTLLREIAKSVGSARDEGATPRRGTPRGV
jgi:hypothetical protein